MVRHIWVKFRSPVNSDQRRSMSATLAPASAIRSRPLLVRSIGPAGQVAQVGEVVHELGGGGQAQLRAVRQLGEPDAAHPDVAEDLEVRLANVAVAGVGAGSGQVISELAKQPDQQLPDGQPVRCAVS